MDNKSRGIIKNIDRKLFEESVEVYESIQMSL